MEVDAQLPPIQALSRFFALIAQTPDDAEAVPLVAARATSVTILIIAVVVTRPGAPAPQVLGVAIVAGALDMAANGLFLWSTLDGDLAIVGALVSLFPATTVLLAVVFLGERLDRKQITGLALAITAAALLSSPSALEQPCERAATSEPARIVHLSRLNNWRFPASSSATS